jgi:signal transduction histidine kinase
MRERVELAGGSFEIGPRSPTGTTVGFRLPLS